MGTEPFSAVLLRAGTELVRARTTTLQVNVGRLCNQACRHCHLEAGPDSQEVMSAAVAREVVAYAQRGGFQVVDITGGAPELNPAIAELMENLAAVAPKVILRSNLTALVNHQRKHLMDLCRKRRVVIIASLPAPSSAQTDAMRGKGTLEKSIGVLRELNALGYGHSQTGLELHLVSNPAGAFLPPPQAQTEARFRRDLHRKHGVSFNNLYTFANVPLGRFRRWLMDSGNFEAYLARLAGSFNRATLDGLMCRSLVSVSWEGYLYDCDFNQAGGLFMGGRRMHVSEMEGLPAAGNPIAVSDHCYACTAGPGFT